MQKYSKDFIIELECFSFHFLCQLFDFETGHRDGVKLLHLWGLHSSFALKARGHRSLG